MLQRTEFPKTGKSCVRMEKTEILKVRNGKTQNKKTEEIADETDDRKAEHLVCQSPVSYTHLEGAAAHLHALFSGHDAGADRRKTGDFAGAGVADGKEDSAADADGKQLRSCLLCKRKKRSKASWLPPVVRQEKSRNEKEKNDGEKDPPKKETQHRSFFLCSEFMCCKIFLSCSF